MDNNNFETFLNESQEQFTDLFEGPIGSVVKLAKKSGKSIAKGIKNSGELAKTVGGAVKDAAIDKAKHIKDNKNTSQPPAKREHKSQPPAKREHKTSKKEKSGLDGLDTVSKNESNVKDKVKAGAAKVTKNVKEVVKDPIKAGTAVGAVAGGVAGGALGFGIGAMVKDVADGVKQVKGKLLENINFDQMLLESQQQFTDLFESNELQKLDEFNINQFKKLNRLLPDLIMNLDDAYIACQVDTPLAQKILKDHKIDSYKDFEVLRGKLVSLQKTLVKLK